MLNARRDLTEILEIVMDRDDPEHLRMNNGPEMTAWALRVSRHVIPSIAAVTIRITAIGVLLAVTNIINAIGGALTAGDFPSKAVPVPTRRRRAPLMRQRIICRRFPPTTASLLPE
jgi:hypothetical protein